MSKKISNRVTWVYMHSWDKISHTTFDSPQDCTQWIEAQNARQEYSRKLLEINDDSVRSQTWTLLSVQKRVPPISFAEDNDPKNFFAVVNQIMDPNVQVINFWTRQKFQNWTDWKNDLKDAIWLNPASDYVIIESWISNQRSAIWHQIESAIAANKSMFS